ncbi:M48 family metalloprotease [Kiloniella laminariae]|uniref:M48 family metalloprotease n=1 Tax=Kiloniella laminariae TaxID=454162 RepID=A0ABT4LK39_9PROT|nr:M48 family metalloprotease [Kiloniella laminariae]MCZ4281465.1 M48 family metalloprotease [Kiloniella laminariae]
MTQHSFSRFKRPLLALALLAAGPLLSACSTSEATGRTFFNGGMSAEQEQQVGREQHGKILEEFGGAYDEDPALTSYISSIGNFLAKTSETPDQQFTFTVLDSPIVNAFALPGGYVYTTRGLLALANDEAEVAGVLAHEIGHVTAKHSAERYGSTVAASVLAAGLGILTGSGEVAQAASSAGALAVQGFSRDQEFEADLLGVRYLSRGQFDPNGMGDFLTQLQASSRLDAKIAGDPDRADQFNIMQTHPRTADRIDRAIKQAGTVTVKDPIVGRDVYLGKIDGILYGDSPAQGYVRGQRFSHPDLELTFTAPDGFRLINGKTQVAAVAQDDSVIIFDGAKGKVSGSLKNYMTGVWAKNISLNGVENITINGMDAATGQARVQGKSGPRDIRLVAIRFDADKVYRLTFISNPDRTTALSEDFRRTTYSFNRLSKAEAAKLKPYRLRIHTVRSGDTVHSLSRKMPFSDYPLERFLVLNGLNEQSPLTIGQKVKLVTE